MVFFIIEGRFKSIGGFPMKELLGLASGLSIIFLSLVISIWNGLEFSLTGMCSVGISNIRRFLRTIGCRLGVKMSYRSSSESSPPGR